MTQSDAQLVQETLAGNNPAFAALVSRYERSVLAVATRQVQSTHAADDVAQEAFVKAYQQLPNLRNPKAFAPWLMKITRRCALDSLRQQQDVKYADNLDQMAVHERNGRLEPDHQHLLEAVARLPESEKQVVMLRYFGPHSVRDVADIVGRNVGTVTKQLSRAHKRLKRHMQESEK